MDERNSNPGEAIDNIARHHLYTSTNASLALSQSEFERTGWHCHVTPANFLHLLRSLGELCQRRSAFVAAARLRYQAGVTPFMASLMTSPSHTNVRRGSKAAVPYACDAAVRVRARAARARH